MTFLKTKKNINGDSATKIVRTPGTCGGSPRIDGTRIRVMDVVEKYEFLDYTPEKIAESFRLSLAQVFAALSYYYENPKEINAEIKDHDEFVKKLRGNGRN